MVFEAPILSWMESVLNDYLDMKGSPKLPREVYDQRYIRSIGRVFLCSTQQPPTVASGSYNWKIYEEHLQIGNPCSIVGKIKGGVCLQRSRCSDQGIFGPVSISRILARLPTTAPRE
jgi:hypothetical protein